MDKRRRGGIFIQNDGSRSKTIKDLADVIRRSRLEKDDSEINLNLDNDDDISTLTFDDNPDLDNDDDISTLTFDDNPELDVRKIKSNISRITFDKDDNSKDDDKDFDKDFDKDDDKDNDKEFDKDDDKDIENLFDKQLDKDYSKGVSYGFFRDLYHF